MAIQLSAEDLWDLNKFIAGLDGLLTETGMWVEGAHAGHTGWPHALRIKVKGGRYIVDTVD